MPIKIDDTWSIDADRHNVILREHRSGGQNKRVLRDGDPKGYTRESFFSTVRQAVQAICESTGRKMIAEENFESVEKYLDKMSEFMVELDHKLKEGKRES